MTDASSGWVMKALEADGLELSLADADGPPVRVTVIHQNDTVMATATSYDCCSQTQTQGPGCCEINPEFGDSSTTANDSKRLWPLAA